MARPLRIEYPGAFYHVTSRGNEQKDVFKSHKDREKFLSYLESASERYGAAIHAWCLMSNHYHLRLSGDGVELLTNSSRQAIFYVNTERKPCRY